MSFNAGGAFLGNFGKNVYLRSTKGCKFESYTLSAASVPTEDVGDGFGKVQKLMQPGTVLAKITSGTEAGKVGPFQAVGTAEVQTATKSGTVSGGTYTLTEAGQTTPALAWNANAATVQAALEALSTIGVGNVVVTGGSVDTAPFTITFQGLRSGDVPQISANTSLLTGSTPGITMATSTAGVGGAVDGRGVLANIVGLCDTFLPWQLDEHDTNVAALYIGTAVQAWCFELDASGARIALSNTTADAMRSVKGLDVTFK